MADYDAGDGNLASTDGFLQGGSCFSLGTLGFATENDPELRRGYLSSGGAIPF